MSERVFCKDCKHYEARVFKTAFFDVRSISKLPIQQCNHPLNLEEEILYVIGKKSIIHYRHPKDKNSQGLCDYYEEKER